MKFGTDHHHYLHILQISIQEIQPRIWILHQLLEHQEHIMFVLETLLVQEPGLLEQLEQGLLGPLHSSHRSSQDLVEAHIKIL